MFTETKGSRKGMSQRRIDLHKQHGMNVRFNDDPPTGDDPPAAGAFTIPEAFKEKPYMSGIDSMEKLCTKLDGAETLIGKKRTIIPDDTSSAVDISAFHTARGVPAEDSLYTPINKEDGADNSFFDALRPALRESNMTQKQVDAFVPKALAIIEKITGEKIASDKKYDEDFTTLADKIFGGTKDNDLAQAKVLLTKYTPEGMVQHMGDLSNEHLIIVAAAMKGIRRDYIKEDSTFDDKGNVATGSSADEYSKLAREQLAIAMDKSKTDGEREAANKKADEYYAKAEASKK